MVCPRKVMIYQIPDFGFQNDASNDIASADRDNCQVMAAHDGHNNVPYHRLDTQIIHLQKSPHQQQLERYW